MRQWLETLAPAREVPSSASPALRAWGEERVGPAAVAWAAEITAVVTSRLADQMVDAGRETDVAGARGCEECTITTLVGLAAGSAAEVATPEAALDDARVAARAGIPLERLLRVVWASHAAVQERLLDIIGVSAPADSLLSEVRQLVTLLAQFIDRYVTDMSAIYAQERSESESRLIVERRRLVDAVLAGSEGTEEWERILGIRWNHHHLTAIGWSATGNRAVRPEDDALRFAKRVARSGGGSWLVVERGDHVEFHWSFAHASHLDPALIDAERPERMRLAVGTVEFGLAGFVSSTRAARNARTAGAMLREPPLVVRYDDVSLVALLSADRAQARAFVRRELAGLLGEDAMTAAVRETLRHFLLEGRSRQAAAAATHVATTTVAYRVKRAEELLGRSVFVRTQETLAALALAHAFPEFAARDPASI
ncbi:helix-turn-helix domain-containing protein [Microbacterium sp. NPDC091313]